jgi:hypothetical protein
MCTGANVLHTECGWERGEVGTALARDEKNLPMNEKPTRLFVVDRPTFSWEIAEEPQRKPRKPSLPPPRALLDLSRMTGENFKEKPCRY